MRHCEHTAPRSYPASSVDLVVPDGGCARYRSLCIPIRSARIAVGSPAPQRIESVKHQLDSGNMTPVVVRASALATIVLSCGAIACRSTPGSVPPWQLLGTTPELTASLDTSRVLTDSIGTKIRIRIDWTSTRRVKAEGDVDSSPAFRRTDLIVYVHCGSRQVRNVSMEAFDTLGVSLGDGPFADTSWVSFDNHEATNVYFDLACAALHKAGKT